MEKTIERREYLQTLFELKDLSLIKVITGVRRSGKSTLLLQFRNKLLEDISEARIQFYNFERRENLSLKGWTEIYDEINEKLIKNKKNYIFLDEIQEIKEFERLLDALYVNEDVDLYVTGSNAYLLSSELATLLTGRAYTLNILPFSFKEFFQTYAGEKEKSEIFMDYLNYSSLPQAVELLHINPNLVNSYVNEVFESIFKNDIAMRYNFGSEKAFRDVVNFMVDNIGNMFSANKIAEILTKNNKKIDSRTVENYLGYLRDSYVLYEVKRFDVKGKQLLKTQSKYYLSDVGFRGALLGKEANADMGRLLENVVYLELLRRGNEVWLGKVGDKEIDFVAKNANGEMTYYQVAYTVRDVKTLNRELASFNATKNHSPKVLITMDPEENIYDGVKQVNAIKFLLG